MAEIPFGIPQGFLFVPARERSLKDPQRFKDADALIFDLEDSLKDEEKDEGLRLLCKLTADRKPEGQKWYVRLNRERLEKELSCLRDSALDGFMIPKFEDTKVLDQFEALIGHREIAALIESPAGVAGMDELSADERISVFAFGAEDFCACLNVEANTDATSYARGRIVLYSAMNKKTCLDMISREFRNREAFEEDLRLSMRTGFGGKLLIHPMQLEVIGEIKKSIPKDEIRSIIEAYEKDPAGAVKIDGRLYEKMHIERLKKLL